MCDTNKKDIKISLHRSCCNPSNTCNDIILSKTNVNRNMKVSGIQLKYNDLPINSKKYFNVLPNGICVTL